MKHLVFAFKWTHILRKSGMLFCTVVGALFFGCSPRLSDAYAKEYSYLRDIRECAPLCRQFQGKEEYFLVVLVDARHLDYASPDKFFASMRYGVLFPQEPTIGHAWIVLSGVVNGKPWRFEGGHTGEFGVTAPRYFDEVVRRSQEKDPNPAQYLFTSLSDGRLQKGSGGHEPTLSVAFSLTEQEFLSIFTLLTTYNFSEWSLQHHQCVHFVCSCLKALQIDIPCERVMRLPSTFLWKGDKVDLWQDRKYEMLSLPTPEALERALFEKVLQKKAFLATKWYMQIKER